VCAVFVIFIRSLFIELTCYPACIALKIFTAGAKHEVQQKGKADAKDDYNSSNEDYSDDGDEDADSYKPGGYHPVEIGEVYHKRYQIVEKMGWGHFSTVWLCLDLHVQKASPSKDSTVAATRPLYVAMKIQKSASHYRDAAFDEIELLQSTVVATTKEEVVKEHGAGFNSRVVILLDDFEHQGPNGRHVCMVFEMLGENLLRVIKNFDYKGMSLEIVRNFTREICIGLDFLHRHCQIIHTDLKPENILVATPCTPKESSLKALVPLASNKTYKKSGDQKQPKKTSGGASGGEKDSNTGSKPPTSEQKKKQKRKLKKKRQKAKRSGKTATAPKETEKNMFVLSAADELKEMALMEKASEPVATSTVAAASHDDRAQTTGGGLEINTDDQLAVDDWTADDDVSTSSLEMTGSSYQMSLESLSPPYKQNKGHSSFSHVMLRSREAQPWLRHTLLAAINFRSVQYSADQLRDLALDSPVAEMPAPLSPSPSPSCALVDTPPAAAPSPLGLSAIDPGHFSYPSTAMWTVIHMVSAQRADILVVSLTCVSDLCL
jgi:serine/threonine protein kinase